MRRRTAARLSLITLVVAVWLSPASVTAVQVVVPNGLESTEGTADNGYPFNIGSLGSSPLGSIRYQQVYDSSQFEMAGVGVIKEIRFRQDRYGSGFETTVLPSIQVYMSTTSRGPDELSTLFEDNLGVDTRLVYSGDLSLASGVSTAVPKPFDIVIPLQEPYRYDPGRGHLLLEVRNSSSTRTTQFDAQRGWGDPSSRVFGSSAIATEGGVDSLALVTMFVIEPVDTTPPTLWVPADVFAEATGPLGAVVVYPAPVAEDESGQVTVSCDWPTGSVFPLGITSVTCVAGDGSGNVTSGSFRVVVQDTTPPTIESSPDVIVRTLDRDGTVPVEYPAPRVTDLVDPVPVVTCDPPSGALFPVGTTAVVCRATDASGNVAASIFSVYVNFINLAPTAVAFATPGAVRGGATVALDGRGSYDPNGDQLTFSWTQLMSSGEEPVVLTDPSGATTTFQAPVVGGVLNNEQTLTFRLSVSDGELSQADDVQVTVTRLNNRPVADAGDDQTVLSGRLAVLDGSASTDPDGDPLGYRWEQVTGPPVTVSADGSAQPSFIAPAVDAPTTLRFRLTVTDTELTSDPDEVVVTVIRPNDPPQCDLARASQPALWPPDHRMRLVDIVGVSDPDNNGVTIQVTGVTQDEPVNGLGDGDTGPDAVILGERVALRAERAGYGNGRVYDVAFTATDALGAACDGRVEVRVPISLKSGGLAWDDGQVFDSLSR
jgi:K319-like protein/HYR domain-containing protein